MKAYKMEVRITILLTVLFLLAGNVALIFSVFPVEGYLFGFPIMYIVPILSGWFGIFFLTIAASRLGNRIDEEIEKENNSKKAHKKERNSEEGA